VASLRQLAWIVARDVNRTVGGGIAAMELLRRTFMARGWLDESTNALLVAVSRLTPGTNILAYCAAAGWRMRGWRGSAAALAAASLPSSLIIFALIATLVRVVHYRSVQAALAVGMLVACWLIFAAAWHLLKPYLRGGARTRALVMIGAALALYTAGVTPVRILLLSAVAGFVLQPVPRRDAASPS
jgi:chromate transporter